MDEKSLAVAYGIKRRGRKGEITHESQATDAGQARRERLKQMLFEGGEVKQEEPADFDSLFSEGENEEAPEVHEPEESPEMKRKARLKGLLSDFEDSSLKK